MVKTRKQDRYLKDLFRNKLENAEVVPDPVSYDAVMHRLAVREFLSFTPFRMNIFYLGGIAAAIITAAIFLTGGKLSDRQKSELVQPGSLHPGDSIEILKTVPLKNPEPAGKNVDGKAVLSSQSKNGDFPSVHQAGREGNVAPEPAVKNMAAGRIDSKFTTNGIFSGDKGKTKSLIDKGTRERLQIEPVLSSGCAPLKVLFKYHILSGDSCLWNFGDGGTSGQSEPEWIYDLEGNYNIRLMVFRADGTIESDSASVTVYPKPVAKFEIQNDRILFPDEGVSFRNYSADGVKYLWKFGDGETSELFEPVHRYTKFGNYNVSLKVFSEDACSDSLVVYNALSGSAFFIIFPNAFIPNEGGPSGGVYSSKSDESAQVFHPSYSGVSEYHLKIFSKLGVLIFESNDISIGWDGYFNGKLNNPGVYIWKVRGKYINGEPFTKMGDVTLLKN